VVATVLVAASTAHALPLYGVSINEGGTWTGSCTEVGGTNTIDAGQEDPILQNSQDFSAVSITG